jgi:hypothetical protein
MLVLKEKSANVKFCRSAYFLGILRIRLKFAEHIKMNVRKLSKSGKIAIASIDFQKLITIRETISAVTPPTTRALLINSNLSRFNENPTSTLVGVEKKIVGARKRIRVLASWLLHISDHGAAKRSVNKVPVSPIFIENQNRPAASFSPEGSILEAAFPRPNWDTIPTIPSKASDTAYEVKASGANNLVVKMAKRNWRPIRPNCVAERLRKSR